MDAVYKKAVSRFDSILNKVAVTDQAGRHLELSRAIEKIHFQLSMVSQSEGTIWIIGNGGSAAIASHIQTDLVNQCKLRAQVVHEPSLMTCHANDYGYENAYARMLKQFIRTGDLVFVVSSSGQSKNLLNAVDVALGMQVPVISFTGFSSNNLLRQKGDLNLWIPSKDYGEVEVAHLFLLHFLADAYVQVEVMA